MLRRYFIDHPASVGETYFEHAGVAGGFGIRLFKASACCFVHALIPGLFTRTASALIGQLHDDMVRGRTRTDHASRDGDLPSAAAAPALIESVSGSPRI